MPYFRVDDGLHSHRKVLKLGAENLDALTLWTLAGSWSAFYLTDGWVPEYVAASLDAHHYVRRAEALVRVGMWEPDVRDGEPGWQFHGWSEPGRNPTSEQVTAERAATAERQKRFRARKKGVAPPAEETAPEGPDFAVESNAVTNGVSHGTVTLPLPFLSLPTSPTEKEEPSTSRTATPPRDTQPPAKPKRAKPKKAAEPREDVEALCNRLAELMVANGCKKPTIGDAWRTDARLLLDADGREFQHAMNLIEWCQKNTFWRRNIRSMPKFRAQYDALRLQALDEWDQARGRPPGTAVAQANGTNVVQIPAPRQSTADQRVAQARAAAANLAARIRAQAVPAEGAGA